MKFLKNFIANLPKTDNADTKISTKGFLVFSLIMVLLIIILVIVLSLF